MITNHIRAFVIFIALVIVFSCIINYVDKFDSAVAEIEQNTDNIYKYICKISEFPYIKGDYIQVFAEVLNTDNPSHITGYKIQFYMDKSICDIVQYGNTIEVYGRIKCAQESANYGNFNQRIYLMSKNTVAICNVENSSDIRCISQCDGIDGMLYKLQQKAILNIDNYFEGKERALIKAMLTGNRTDIDDDLAEIYQKAGIYHIVAVSGLHTGIFISVFVYIMALMPFSKRRRYYISKICAVIISILLYMYTGYGISITRVILMSMITVVCMLLRRDFSITWSIVMAAYIILLFMPYKIFSTAYQLSFLSTYSLCIAINIRQKYLGDKKDGYFVTSMIISAGSALGTAPVCAYCFGFISTMSTVANLAVIPLATALLISSVIFCLLCAVLPSGIISVLKFVPIILAKFINEIAKLVTLTDKCIVKLSLTDILLIYVFFALSLCVIISIKRHKFANTIITMLVFSFTLSSLSCSASNKTKVTFLNCLDGECTIVTTPAGNNIMFDCGSSDFTNPGEDLFETYFMHNGIKRIDTLYISYFDNKHISAADKLMVMGYIGEIVLPDKTHISDKQIRLNRKKLINTAKRFGVPITYINSKFSRTTDGVNISILCDNLDMNDTDACAVYKIEYGDVSFLLSSCVGEDGVKRITSDAKCTVLKIPNYKNVIKATRRYMYRTNPEYAVITAPLKDKFMQNNSLIKMLENKNIPIYRTNYNHTITFVTDGLTINQIKTSKENNN